MACRSPVQKENFVGTGYTPTSGTPSNLEAGSLTRSSCTVPHDPPLLTMESSSLATLVSLSPSTQSYRYSEEILRSSPYVSLVLFMNSPNGKLRVRTSRSDPSSAPARPASPPAPSPRPGPSP